MSKKKKVVSAIKKMRLRSKAPVKTFNNVVVVIKENGEIDAVPTILARTGDPVYWMIDNQSGVTSTVTLGWFKHKVTSKSSKPVIWLGDVSWIRLGSNELGPIGAIVTHRPPDKKSKTSGQNKDRFKYSILVECGKTRMLFDPDLEVSPPPN